MCCGAAPSLKLDQRLFKLSVQTKRGTGRRVGRPPKQVTQKRKFGSLSAGGDDLSTPPKQEPLNDDDVSKATIDVAHVEQGVVSSPEASAASSASAPIESSLSPSLPSCQKQEDNLMHTSPSESSDLVPTSSLWTQSLITDSFGSPSPVSSPIRWFQQQSSRITKSPSSSSTASATDAAAHQSPIAVHELSPETHSAGVSADSTTFERPSTSGEPLLFSKPKPKECGRFVSLSASGIKVSLLEKSLVGKLPTSRVVASDGDFVTLPPLSLQMGHVHRMMMPVDGSPDSAAGLPSLESGIPSEEPLLPPDFMVDADNEGPTALEESERYNTLEGFARNGEEEQGLARLHPEIASALATSSGHVSGDAALGERRALSS